MNTLRINKEINDSMICIFDMYLFTLELVTNMLKFIIRHSVNTVLYYLLEQVISSL